MIVSFLLPFLLSFFLPGMVLAFLFIKRKEIDFLFFIIHLVVYGLLFQITSGFIVSLFSFWSAPIILKVILINVLLILPPGWLLLKKNKEQRTVVRFTSYDGAVILLTVFLLLTIAGNVSQLPNEFFNPATDQYHWLSKSQRNLNDVGVFFKQVLLAAIHRPVFFLVLNNYLAFFPKDLSALQGFILIWSYFNYGLLAMAVARLAAELLPIKTLGLLAPLIIYALHWSNYYIISTAVVPQNLALFLLTSGFIFANQKIRPVFTFFFLLLFYLIHLPTLAIFILIIGASRLFKESKRLILKEKTDWWHPFELLAFLPTLIVTVLYLLYLFNVLEFFDPQLIGYYQEYLKDLGILDHPYIELQQTIIVWLAVAGALLILAAAFFLKNLSPGLIPLAFGLLLPLGLLKTPLIAYHAFYASWQSFRYLLVLYPALAVLALTPLAAVFSLIKKYFSSQLALALLFLMLMILIPGLLTIVSQQQQFVFLDMITGRDNGSNNLNIKKEIEQMSALEKKFLAALEKSRPVFVSTDVNSPIRPYLEWVFTPRPVLVGPEKCSLRSCILFDFPVSQRLDWFETDLVAAIIEKKQLGRAIMPEILTETFNQRQEQGDFYVYSNSGNK